MNQLYKQYLKNAKALFPIWGKAEKEYFKKLELNVIDYYAENPIASLEKLYEDFGSPSDIANSYFSSADTDYVLKQIRRTKAIKTAILMFIIAIFIALVAYCALLHSSYKVFQEEQMFSEETVIE